MTARHFIKFLSSVAIVMTVVVAAATEPRAEGTLRGTGDLGIVIERAAGSILIIETTEKSVLKRVEGLGDLSHASAVFSRDGRYTYIFGRDGGLTKVDLLTGKIIKRVIQSGNSIGGAISQDGKLVAVSNYKPGGVKVFDSGTLDLVADIPTFVGEERSKVIGLVDAPDQKFLFSLWDGDEIWLADFAAPSDPKIKKFKDVGSQPYDALITDDGRYYVAGLYGEDGLAKLDLWNVDAGVSRILDGYGRGEEKLPVYKMPHLEGWARAGDKLFLPAVGRHEVLVVDANTWREVGRIKVHGQPIFVVARPDGRQVWVNFAHPRNDTVQVIDVPTLQITKSFTPGKAVLHMEFTPRGEHVFVSVRDADKVNVYDTNRLELIKSFQADKPSGIFLTARAGRTGL